MRNVTVFSRAPSGTACLPSFYEWMLSWIRSYPCFYSSQIWVSSNYEESPGKPVIRIMDPNSWPPACQGPQKRPPEQTGSGRLIRAPSSCVVLTALKKKKRFRFCWIDKPPRFMISQTCSAVRWATICSLQTKSWGSQSSGICLRAGAQSSLPAAVGWEHRCVTVGCGPRSCHWLVRWVNHRTWLPAHRTWPTPLSLWGGRQSLVLTHGIHS